MALSGFRISLARLMFYYNDYVWPFSTQSRHDLIKQQRRGYTVYVCHSPEIQNLFCYNFGWVAGRSSFSFHFVYVAVLLKLCWFYTNKDSLWHATESMSLAIAPLAIICAHFSDQAQIPSQIDASFSRMISYSFV